MRTYLFYDIETTGLNKAFDQILQFAAIRTDMNLQELNRYELKIKLNSDAVPSPGALLTHQLSIQDMLNGVTEYDAIRQIHQWLNEPGTISLGYNTLNFDDEFLRFSFYRNLLPPYTHQYANQCSRMDLYPMTVMYYLFKNTALNWLPRNDKVSLKLEDINQANQLASGRAHDAIVDVEITLALAKRFFKEQEMWQYLQGYFNKQLDQQRIDQLQDKQAVLVEGRFGFEKNFQSWVHFLGFHRHYKNQSVWLSLDLQDFQTIPPDELIPTIRTRNKKLGEPGFLLPPRERFIQQLSDERLKLAEHNQLWLQKHPDILAKITEHYLNYTYPDFPETDIDARLYLNGFLSREEEAFCVLFHKASPKEKSKLADQIHNPMLSALAIRILGRHFPEALTTQQAEKFAHYLGRVNTDDEQQIIRDFKGEKRLTPKAALEEISALRIKGELPENKILLLNELETYLKKN